MKTVILGVRNLDASLENFRRVWKSGKAEPAARVSFATPELLWKVLTARRWQIRRAMCGEGPLSIREIARRVGRDIKAVHSDVHALTIAGVLERTADRRTVFPYDAMRVDCLLKAA
ncbi:MAG: transcriptional regulator [Acetobacteraceae bacterium]